MSEQECPRCGGQLTDAKIIMNLMGKYIKRPPFVEDGMKCEECGFFRVDKRK